MAKLTLALIALSGLALAGCTSDDGGDLKAQLHALYSDKPYLNAAGTAPVDTPAHEWLVKENGGLLFLHWNNDDPMAADMLAFTGDGIGPVKGCVGAGGISQAQIDAGFNHFHKLRANDFAAGHHMDPNNKDVMGYWLRHFDASSGGIFNGLDSTHLAQNPLKAC